MTTIFGKRNMTRLRKSQLMALNIETSLRMSQDESLSERDRIAHLYSANSWIEAMHITVEKVFDDLHARDELEQATWQSSHLSN